MDILSFNLLLVKRLAAERFLSNVWLAFTEIFANLIANVRYTDSGMFLLSPDFFLPSWLAEFLPLLWACKHGGRRRDKNIREAALVGWVLGKHAWLYTERCFEKLWKHHWVRSSLVMTSVICKSRPSQCPILSVIHPHFLAKERVGTGRRRTKLFSAVFFRQRRSANDSQSALWCQQQRLVSAGTDWVLTHFFAAN